MVTLLNRLPAILACCIVLAACAQQQAQPQSAAGACTAPRLTGRLPAAITEASGLAASLRHDAIWWTLQDDGPPVLVAIDSTGTVRGQVAIRNAENRDWESLTAARCGDGSCLYIGDIGDNERRHGSITVYRIPEPQLTQSTVDAAALELHYPGNSRYDAEAIFVLPGDRLYLVTKGRGEPITVFRAPARFGTRAKVVLEPVQQLSAALVQLPELVTGAGATPDGAWVVLRTYAALQLYRLEGDTLEPVLPGAGVDLAVLQEAQGEGVDIRSDGRVLLVSEQGLGSAGGAVSVVTCNLKSGS